MLGICIYNLYNIISLCVSNIVLFVDKGVFFNKDALYTYILCIGICLPTMGKYFIKTPRTKNALKNVHT